MADKLIADLAPFVGAPVGTEVMEIDDGTSSWKLPLSALFAAPSSGGAAYHGGFTDPTTTDGDFIVRKTTGVTELSILFIGDSITSGQLVTTAPVGPCATNLSLGAVTVTGVNQGVPGSTSANWAPGGSNLTAALAAGATAGSRIAHIMLGTNDSGTPVSQADYRAHMEALCGELVTDGYIVVLSYPPYAPDHITAVTSYCRAIDSMVDNFHIFQGDTQAQSYFHDNPGQLQSDNIHPTQTGSDALAGLWAQALQALVNGITNQVVLQRAVMGGVMRLDTSRDVATITSAEVLRASFIGATVGMKRRLAIPFGAVVQGWEILADVSGSVTVDVQAGDYSAYPVAASICSSAKPSIASATKAKSSTLTGWTTSLDDDSFLLFNVDSITTISDFEICLICQYGAAGAPPPVDAVTWNPLDKGSTISLSSDKLTATQVGFTFQSVRATQSFEASTAARYFSIVLGPSGSQTVVGIMTAAADVSQFVGNDAFGWGAYGNDGGTLHSGAHATYGSTFGTSGDQILFVLKAGKIYWRLNGTWQGSGDPSTAANPAFSGLSGAVFAAVSMLNNTQTCTADFTSVDADAKLAGCTPWGV